MAIHPRVASTCLLASNVVHSYNNCSLFKHIQSIYYTYIAFYMRIPSLTRAIIINPVRKWTNRVQTQSRKPRTTSNQTHTPHIQFFAFVVFGGEHLCTFRSHIVCTTRTELSHTHTTQHNMNYLQVYLASHIRHSNLRLSILSLRVVFSPAEPPSLQSIFSWSVFDARSCFARFLWYAPLVQQHFPNAVRHAVVPGKGNKARLLILPHLSPSWRMAIVRSLARQSIRTRTKTRCPVDTNTDIDTDTATVADSVPPESDRNRPGQQTNTNTAHMDTDTGTQKWTRTCVRIFARMRCRRKWAVLFVLSSQIELFLAIFTTGIE